MKKYRHKHLRHKIKSLKPKKSLLKRRGFWISFLIIFLTATAFYLIFFFPPIQVKAIQISGNEILKTQDLQNSAWKNLNLRNIFIINSDKLKKELLTGFPGVEDVEIKKEWFSTLHLQITERKPVAIFCLVSPDKDNACFLIDKNGVTYEPTTATSGYFTILGQTPIDKNTMTTILKIKNNLKNNFQINIKEALASNPLIITTTENWKIYFDPAGDIDLQITKMNTLLKTEITPKIRTRLQYIYLQYKDRAYYK